MAVYTRRRAFVQRHGEHLVQPFGSRLGLAFSGIFFVSIPVAYISTTLSMVLWVSSIFVRYPLRLVAGRRRRDLAVDLGHLAGHVGPVEAQHVLGRLGHEPVAQLPRR